MIGGGFSSGHPLRINEDGGQAGQILFQRHIWNKHIMSIPNTSKEKDLFPVGYILYTVYNIDILLNKH